MPFHHKVNGPVLQLLHASICKVVVNRPCEDQQLTVQIRHSFPHLKEINRCLHLDILMLDDLLDEVGVALFGQCLEPVREVPVVEVIADGDSSQH